MYEPRRVSFSGADAGIPESRLRPRWRLITPETPPQLPEEAKTPEASAPESAAALAQAAEPDTEAEEPPPAKKRRPWLKRVGLAAGGLALMVAGYGAWLGVSIMNAEGQIYKPRPATATPTVSRPLAAVPTGTSGIVAPQPTATSTADPLSGLPPGRFNILVMGTDKRPNDPDHYARSDTMILLNLDPEGHKVRALTLPRDLVVTIPGYGVNKINSAYLFGEYYQEPGGGQALAADTISQLFNVPIDYYLTINFDGFRKLIDTLGGIDIDVPYEIDDYHYPSDDEGDPFGELHVHFDPGLQHMDGKTALRYARTRHADNDFMRSRRQLQVMLAARQSATSLNLIPRLPSIVDQLGGMVETDIPFDKQLSIARFAYTLHTSDLITATIDSQYISPVVLDDGSEGLALDWEAAQPMLDEFFGRTITAPSHRPTPTRTPKATLTPGKGTALKKTATRTPTDERPSRATHTPTASRPTRTPTVDETLEPTATDSGP